MSAITLKNIPEKLHRRLALAATHNHRSLNKEIIATLERGHPPAQRKTVQDWIKQARAIRRKLPYVEPELIDIMKREGRA